MITPIMRTYDTSKLKTSIVCKIKPKRKFNHNFRDTHDHMCNSNDPTIWQQNVQKNVNTYILNQTIHYINKSKRFEKKTDDDQKSDFSKFYFCFSLLNFLFFSIFPWVRVVPGEMALQVTGSY